MRKFLFTLVSMVALSASAQINIAGGQPLSIAGAHFCAPLADCREALRSPATLTPDFYYRKDVREVRVEFSVTDKHGHHVTALSKADVQLSDNGAAIQDFTDFREQSDLPLRVAIMIDSSRSTGPELPMEKQLAVEFLRRLLRPQDRAMIANFNSRLHLPSSFTDHFDALEDSVRDIRQEGLTAFNDSLYDLAETAFNESSLARNVAIVVTDGHDSVSRRTYQDALDSILRHDVTVYTISIQDRKSLDPDPCLSRLTSQTGGHSYELKNLKKLKSAFDQIDADLRTYYVATYRAPVRDKAAFHSLNLQVATKGLNVQSKKGYFRSE